MRLVPVPPPVVIRTAEISYALFVRHLLDTDDRFTKAATGIRAAFRIEQALTSVADLHPVEESDWVLLKAAAEAPTGGYLTLVETLPDGSYRRLTTGRPCLPFIDAIANATTASTAP